MSKHLQRDLEHLQRDVMTLASAVDEAIYKAARSLMERDLALAQQVIDGDAYVDDLENRVDEECLKILALHQPVAVDLRRIAAVFMINTDLERIGDLAVDIAERAVTLAKPPHVAVPQKLAAMTDQTAAMVKQSLDAFVNLDARQARRVIRLDDLVDRLNG